MVKKFLKYFHLSIPVIWKKRALSKIKLLSPFKDKGTYKQALRGLFTAGTSEFFERKIKRKRSSANKD